MKISNGEKHKKISKIVSIISGLFLLLQVLAGALMPVSLDFWKPGFQN